MTSVSRGILSYNPTFSSYSVVPSIYLKADIKVLQDGNDGSKEHPYNLKL